MALQEEIQEQIQRCMASVPWVLRVTTGEITPEADNVSNEELMHGVQILAIEALRICERLAGEIDQLRAGI